MAVLLRDIKTDLQSDRDKVGKDPNGEYKFIPPNIIGRKLKDYTRLKSAKVVKVARPKKRTPETGVVSYSAVVNSESQPGEKYKVSVWFYDMKFKPMETKQFKEKAFIASKVALRRKSIFHRLPTAQKNPVKVRCQCPDFRHRFENQLSQAGGLVGGPRKYTRKTPPWNAAGTGGRPEVNSTNKLGICKHINSFLLHLKDKKMVREAI